MSTEDDSFLEHEEDRREYLLCDRGIIWRGNERQPLPTPWYYGQVRYRTFNPLFTPLIPPPIPSQFLYHLSIPFPLSSVHPISIIICPSHFLYHLSIPFPLSSVHPISIIICPSHFHYHLSIPFPLSSVHPISFIICPSHFHYHLSIPFPLSSVHPISFIICPSHFLYHLSIPFPLSSVHPISFIICPSHFHYHLSIPSPLLIHPLIQLILVHLVFLQFEESCLDAAISLIGSLGPEECQSATLVSRGLISKINARDNTGVLVSGYTGSLSAGIHPCRWTGSAAILQKYNRSKFPVK